MPRASARASRSSLSSVVKRTSMGLPAPFLPKLVLVGPGILTGRKRSLSASDASLRARISRITRRLSQAASDRNSRSAIALAWSFISGETRVFRVSAQRIGANLAPMLSQWLSCVSTQFAPKPQNSFRRSDDDVHYHAAHRAQELREYWRIFNR